MEKIFEKIWKLALPYQDKRDDKGHAKIVLFYANKLVKLENANKDIVIPAAILHDIGYSQLSKKERFSMFNLLGNKEEKFKVRLKHQKEGVKLAEKILDKLDYDSGLAKEILEIISQHDTREGFISKNEGAMRDADKLWRYSKIGFWIDVKKVNLSKEQLYDKLKLNINKPDFFYSNLSKRIAIEELGKRRSEF